MEGRGDGMIEEKRDDVLLERENKKKNIECLILSIRQNSEF